MTKLVYVDTNELSGYDAERLEGEIAGFELQMNEANEDWEDAEMRFNNAIFNLVLLKAERNRRQGKPFLVEEELPKRK